MLEKITSLKESSANPKVQSLCEQAIANLSNVLLQTIPGAAREDIEKATYENLFAELGKVEEEDINVWLSNEKRIYESNNLGVRDNARRLLEKEGKENPTLKEFLNNFLEAADDKPECLIYEEFISGAQAFSYYPEVGSAVDAIAGRVKSYKNDVNLNKIIETMKLTKSSYLIPFVITHVDNYLNNKTEQNKSILKEALIKFSYDDFVRDIISVVTTDATALQLEFANSECDIDKVHSPLIYLGENEAIFNVKNSFYIKKGNHINRLSKQDLPKLDEEFKFLCEIINSDQVEIIGNDFNVYVGEDHACINENGVKVNEQQFGDEEFKNAAAAAPWAGNTNFLNIVNLIKENLEEIAEVDFVKRVFLKENENYSADVFKLRDNVFIATNNPDEGKSTFYRNVNPMQAKNIMMEHLRYDVSRLFKDILPHEEKIQAEISETKKSYEDYIRLLEAKLLTFQNGSINETTREVIDALSEEIEEVKNEYKDYLNEVEIYMLVPEDVDVSDLSEQITLTIDTGKQKYVVPIPDDGDETISTPPGDEEQATGTIPGEENRLDEPSSAVTFDDEETELLGDSPSIQDDEVDLGSEEVEKDAEEAEAEADKEDEESDVEDDDFASELDADIEDEDEELGDEEQDDEIEKKKKKKDKNESLERNTFVEEGTEDEGPKKPQRKVFLKKKMKK